MSLARKICLALGCVVLTGSAALAVNPPRPLGNGRNAPQSYNDWIQSAIGQINSDDDIQQQQTIDLLSITIVDPAVRQKVLAALQPHLHSPDQALRVKFVTAFGHWSTKDQVRQLEELVEMEDVPQSAATDPLGFSRFCWGEATIQLISLDPNAAKAALERRMGDDFNRSYLIMHLTDITLDNNPSQPAAFALFKQLDPSNPLMRTSIVDALTLLKSDSAEDRIRGANVLAHAVVPEDLTQGAILGGHTEDYSTLQPHNGGAVGQGVAPASVSRAQVLEALRPHINSVNQAAIPFIQAFSHWADRAEIGTLKKIVATDPQKENPDLGANTCWAAALMGLARLAPQGAADAAKSRAAAPLFPWELHRVLEPTARGNSTDSSVACWLIGMLDHQTGQPRVPPEFNPNAQNPAK